VANLALGIAQRAQLVLASSEHQEWAEVILLQPMVANLALVIAQIQPSQLPKEAMGQPAFVSTALATAQRHSVLETVVPLAIALGTVVPFGRYRQVSETQKNRVAYRRASSKNHSHSAVNAIPLLKAALL